MLGRPLDKEQPFLHFVYSDLSSFHSHSHSRPRPLYAT